MLALATPRATVVHSAVDLGGDKLLALTFDDGPSELTPLVLDALRRHAAHATFFVLGQSLEGREDILRRALSEGHELGNHGYSHSHPGWLSDSQLRDELAATAAAVERAVGIAPRLVRPPYGEDPDRVARLAFDLGLGPTVLWSLDPKDWMPPPPERIVEEIVRGARPGAIVDLHDGSRARGTVEALPLVLSALAEEGYRLVTVSELLAASSERRRSRPLRRADLEPDPLEQFTRWFTDAEAAGLPLPEAMALATATRSGRPSARMVLLKAVDERGLVFYSGYGSRKGRELADNARAALLFYWHELGRQVRIEGRVRKLRPEDSERYVRTRPLASRLSALASPQSDVIGSRDELESLVAELRSRHGDDVPLPQNWGGYALTPSELEFWQHRADRLHDRFRYREAGGGWVIERLAP